VLIEENILSFPTPIPDLDHFIIFKVVNRNPFMFKFLSTARARAAMEHEPCEIHKEGQVFYFEENQPEGFCNYAWNAIFPYVTTLSWGGDFKSVYKEPGVAVIACPDGLRPVIFKLELEK